MLCCPNCGTPDNSERYRSPLKVDDVIVRRRLCLACRHVFSTGEIVLSGGLAERILTHLTPAVVRA